MTYPREPERKPIRILIVDGNADFLQVATDFLQRRLGLHVVGTLTRVQDSLAWIRSLDPHVILLDLDTPGHAGLESIPHLKATMPGVSIIALTLSSSSAYEGAARAAGADALVSKAALLCDLLPAIRQVSGSGIFQADRIVPGIVPAAGP